MRPVDRDLTVVWLCEKHSISVLLSIETCQEQYRKVIVAKDMWKRLHQLKPEEQHVNNLFHLYSPSEHKGYLL